MAKILVIDDDPGIRHLLDAVLRLKGYHVLLAENGQKGLDLFRQEQPDVIVLDLELPDMDGVTVLRHIRSHNLSQPVIIFSGAWTPKTEEQIRSIGIIEAVTKDCSLERLADAVQHALNSPDRGEALD